MQNISKGALYLAMQITGSHDEAMDILQTAVVKSLEHRNAPRPEEKTYRAWFYRVVHNQSIDWLRSQKKFDRDADITALESKADDMETLLDQEQRKILLHKALNLLSAEQREIICLKDFHSFSYLEISQIMEIEKGTVMSRLHRARMALKDELIELKVFSGEDHEL